MITKKKFFNFFKLKKKQINYSPVVTAFFNGPFFSEPKKIKKMINTHALILMKICGVCFCVCCVCV